MDPQRCWDELRQALESADLWTAAEMAEDLANWLHKGGFRPAAIGAVSESDLLGFAMVCRAADGSDADE